MLCLQIFQKLAIYFTQYSFGFTASRPKVSQTPPLWPLSFWQLHNQAWQIENYCRKSPDLPNTGIPYSGSLHIHLLHEESFNILGNHWHHLQGIPSHIPTIYHLLVLAAVCLKSAAVWLSSFPKTSKWNSMRANMSIMQILLQKWYIYSMQCILKCFLFIVYLWHKYLSGWRLWTLWIT